MAFSTYTASDGAAFSLGLTGNSFGRHSFQKKIENACIPAIVVMIVLTLALRDWDFRRLDAAIVAIYIRGYAF